MKYFGVRNILVSYFGVRQILSPRKSSWKTLISNYTLIKKSRGILATVKMIDKKYLEKNLSNNKKFIKNCLPYVE